MAHIPEVMKNLQGLYGAIDIVYEIDYFGGKGIYVTRIINEYVGTTHPLH